MCAEAASLYIFYYTAFNYCEPLLHIGLSHSLYHMPMPFLHSHLVSYRNRKVSCLPSLLFCLSKSTMGRYCQVLASSFLFVLFLASTSAATTKSSLCSKVSLKLSGFPKHAAPGKSIKATVSIKNKASFVNDEELVITLPFGILYNGPSKSLPLPDFIEVTPEGTILTWSLETVAKQHNRNIKAVVLLKVDPCAASQSKSLSFAIEGSTQPACDKMTKAEVSSGRLICAS